MIDTRTTAQRWADTVTAFSGSWAFIGWFAVGCVGWIGVNVMTHAGWDPYPFLFLNWVLTMVSTFQSPLILLSQNRQNEVDRDHMRDLLSRLDKLQTAVEKLGANRE